MTEPRPSTIDPSTIGPSETDPSGTVDPDNSVDPTALIDVAIEAGRVIARLYAEGCGVETKGDGSPCTEADRQAEAIILDRLGTLYPAIPVIAEEAVSAGHAPPTPGPFFLVDPLDGTAEFVERIGEFTVNIALIANERPMLGVVHAPMTGETFWGVAPSGVANAPRDRHGAWMRTADGHVRAIETRPWPDDPVAAVSRRRAGGDTEAFLARHDVRRTQACGSSLKFCLVASGRADCYPRFGPTMEWDTAAGHAVLFGAGGCVLDLEGGELRYNKRERTNQADFLNHGFVAWGRKRVEER